MIIEYLKMDRTSKDYAAQRAAAEAALKAVLPNNVLGEAISDDETTSWVKTIAGHGIDVPADAKVSIDAAMSDKTAARQKVITDVRTWEAQKQASIEVETVAAVK